MWLAAKRNASPSEVCRMKRVNDIPGKTLATLPTATHPRAAGRGQSIRHSRSCSQNLCTDTCVWKRRADSAVVISRVSPGPILFLKDHLMYAPRDTITHENDALVSHAGMYGNRVFKSQHVEALHHQVTGGHPCTVGRKQP